jgi:hypothetical protein
LSHFFKVGDVLKARLDLGTFIVLGYGKGQDIYTLNIVADSFGFPYKDEFPDVEIYLNPDHFTLATELEKALL